MNVEYGIDFESKAACGKCISRPTTRGCEVYIKTFLSNQEGLKQDLTIRFNEGRGMQSPMRTVDIRTCGEIC